MSVKNLFLCSPDIDPVLSCDVCDITFNETFCILFYKLAIETKSYLWSEALSLCIFCALKMIISSVWKPLVYLKNKTHD